MLRRIFARRFRRTTLLTAAYAGFLGGIGISFSGKDIGAALCWCALAFVLLAWRSHNVVTLGTAIFLGLSVGWWHGAVYAHKLAIYDKFQYQKTTVTARAMDDALYNKTKQLSFDANGVTLADGEHLPGKIELSGFGADAIYQGDYVEASGKLYPGYGSYQGSISYAELTVLARHPTIVSRIRQKFTAGMQTALPAPLAAFAMGLLVGQRANLPAGIKQDLLMVGLTHIIAVSGYNLTIILRASQRVLGHSSKRLSTLLSLALIGVFMLLAGASASIVRAAIVSLLSIAAGYYGRGFKPVNLILLAAAITGWMNPAYVWSDVSWYLSFLAFFGVMVISPSIQERYPRRWYGSVAGAVALESVCAEIMSLPFVLYIFGQMSLIGLPANVLVVALIPLAMLLSALAGVAGMLAAGVAGWIAWPAQWLLNYMLDVSHILAGLPHIFIQNRDLSLAGMLTLYALIAGVTVTVKHKTKRPNNATITDMERLDSRGVEA